MLCLIDSVRTRGLFGIFKLNFFSILVTFAWETKCIAYFDCKYLWYDRISFLKKNSATKIVSLISETLVVLNCVAPFFVLPNKRTFSGFLTALLRFVVLCQVTLAFFTEQSGLHSDCLFKDQGLWKGWGTALELNLHYSDGFELGALRTMPFTVFPMTDSINSGKNNRLSIFDPV